MLPRSGRLISRIGTITTTGNRNPGIDMTAAITTKSRDDELFSLVPEGSRIYLLDQLRNAVSSQHFHLLGFPGWTQAEEFTADQRARYESDPITAEQAAGSGLTPELLVEIRLRLRRTLTLPDMVTLEHVIGEHAIQNLIDEYSPAAARAQITRLIGLAEQQPGVCDERTTLRLLPLRRSGLRDVPADFGIIKCADGRNYVANEAVSGCTRESSAHGLDLARQQWARVSAAAMGPDRTRERLAWWLTQVPAQAS